jgi:hypothetical protein
LPEFRWDSRISPDRLLSLSQPYRAVGSAGGRPRKHETIATKFLFCAAGPALFDEVFLADQIAHIFSETFREFSNAAFFFVLSRLCEIGKPETIETLNSVISSNFLAFCEIQVQTVKIDLKNSLNE